jgi:ABC-type transporter Mla MlaB component
MLRVTVSAKRKTITFQLEGKIAVPWLQELENCWDTTVARVPEPVIRVDLSGVTFIDSAGQACLAAMYRQGAEFIAPDCVTKDLVREIQDDCSRELLRVK